MRLILDTSAFRGTFRRKEPFVPPCLALPQLCLGCADSLHFSLHWQNGRSGKMLKRPSILEPMIGVEPTT